MNLWIRYLKISRFKMLVAIVVISLLLPHISSSYFQQCELVECFLFPKMLSTKNQYHSEDLPGNSSNTIIDVMKLNGLNKMTDLLEKTGLASTLRSSGPWTVFAIIDEGFDELETKSPTWFNSLTTNMTVATAIMSNHIVNESLPYSAIRPGKSAMSLEGPIFFDLLNNNEKGIFVVNGSSRIIEDLEASNGRIYVVSNHIIEDIFSMLSFFPTTIGVDFSILIEALKISGLSNKINQATAGPFTLFAPTNKAMKSLPNGSIDALISNPSKLKQLLLNHMLPNALFIKDDKKPTTGFLKTIGGASIPFQKNADGLVTVGMNQAKVLFSNRPGNNGVNHIIDQVIVLNE